ncbi:hypothetical protein CK203_043254 [Vitis vinifera]|uniref:Uncharacterized protein n=1 Tax=Vitis vinifera TaxID=29760 RepID=A0A438HPC6_VITVI|nr:hypothetical protein CK203_043254 [Vitis vinifera]
MEGWVEEDCRALIKPCKANGCRDFLLSGRVCGGRLYMKILGRWARFMREFKLKDASLTLLIIAFFKNAIVYGMEEVKVAVGRLD